MEVNSVTQSTWKEVPDKRWVNLISQPDHYEIKGSLIQADGSNEFTREVKAEGNEKSPNILQRAYRVASRTQAQKDEYRNGIENLRELLRERYDQNAVERFDNHFSYRRWAGKPLTVRAFKVFIAQEEQLRQGGLNISTLKQETEKLEDLQKKLSDKKKQMWRVIGGSKVPSGAKTDYSFPFLPIKRSWFEFSANAEDKKKGREEGIEEARKAIKRLIKDPTTQGHVEHLFVHRFAEQISKKETLKVEELSAFIDAAIKLRDDENKMLGGLYSAVTSAQQNKENVEEAVCKFLKNAYHALGIAAGAAVVANAEAGINDPITALAKGVAAGSVVAAETDSQRILTAIALHFTATPPAAQSTWSSASILKFFTFGLY